MTRSAADVEQGEIHRVEHGLGAAERPREERGFRCVECANGGDGAIGREGHAATQELGPSRVSAAQLGASGGEFELASDLLVRTACRFGPVPDVPVTRAEYRAFFMVSSSESCSEVSGASKDLSDPEGKGQRQS